LRRRANPGLLGWPFWVGHLAPFAGLIGFLSWRRHTNRVAADPVGQKRRKAYRTAVEQLSTPNGRSKDGNGTFETVADALLGYYGDRFNRPASGARRQDIREDLTRDGVPDPHISAYLSILDECDRNRYARTDGSHATVDISERAKRALANLEGAKS
jgi:hypothetical protein